MIGISFRSRGTAHIGEALQIFAEQNSVDTAKYCNLNHDSANLPLESSLIHWLQAYE